ncbi:AAA family ATPase [Candidatus Woesearchaeota archaeon]|nr:AAA family ATPase [Candidatus Woesearchaeota archaeon]
MKVILVTGSVGSGKTTLSIRLAKEAGFRYADVNKIVRKYGLSEGYDRARKTLLIDAKKLNKALNKEIIIIKKNKKVKGIIIDSHLSHNFPAKQADLCIVTKCGLKVLSKRLRKRKYNEKKIRENLDAEIFDVCHEESKEKGHNILVVDTTKGINSKVLSSVMRRLNEAG